MWQKSGKNPAKCGKNWQKSGKILPDFAGFCRIFCQILPDSLPLFATFSKKPCKIRLFRLPVFAGFFARFCQFFAGFCQFFASFCLFFATFVKPPILSLTVDNLADFKGFIPSFPHFFHNFEKSLMIKKRPLKGS